MQNSNLLGYVESNGLCLTFCQLFDNDLPLSERSVHGNCPSLSQLAVDDNIAAGEGEFLSGSIVDIQQNRDHAGTAADGDVQIDSIAAFDSTLAICGEDTELLGSEQDDPAVAGTELDVPFNKIAAIAVINATPIIFIISVIRHAVLYVNPNISCI